MFKKIIPVKMNFQRYLGILAGCCRWVQFKVHVKNKYLEIR